MVAPRRAAFAEEAAEVEVLYANLEKMKSLTKKIQGSMARLDVSGRTVQDAIGPVYGNTQRLQTTNANVDRVLAAIEKAKEPLDMRNKEERIIRSGPDKVGLTDYIGSIDRTNQALKDLKASNMRSNQQAISELSGMLSVGTQNLEDVFRDLLRQDSQPIEPLKQITTGTEFPRLSAAKSTELRTINTHISNFASISKPGELAPSAKVYAHERGQYITVSLQNLSAASLSTARKVTVDAVYRQNSNAIGSYAQGIQGMFTAEYDNICPIFSREEWGPVLSATCQSPLKVFAGTLKDLDAHIRSNLVTDCYLAYEIIEVVSNTSFHLESKTGEWKLAMSDALKPIRETAKSSLSTLLVDIRTKIQQMQALPVDGAAVSLTTEVMTRLQLMTSYLPPLSSIMRSLGDGGWTTPNHATSSTSIPTLKSFDVGADGKQLFAHYSTDTIDTLLNNLESRARVMLKGRSLQGVFLANNLAIVERMIRASELAPLLTSAAPKLEVWKKKSTQSYLDAWKEPSAHLLDVQYTAKAPRPPSTGQAIDSAAILKNLSSKDKDGIKEKFKNFNLAFDELVAKHKSLRMEPEVRRQLGRDVQMFIEPLYARFWERYHDVDKGKGKYAKYDKAQLSSILASLA
nr:exocyst complex protein exo70 [Quercus suber]